MARAPRPGEPGYRYPAKVRSRARILYTRYGWGPTRIARHLDVPVLRVRTWIAEVNPCTGLQRRYDRQAVLQALRDGVPRSQICEQHGCSARWLSDLASGKIPP